MGGVDGANVVVVVVVGGVGGVNVVVVVVVNNLLHTLANKDYKIDEPKK